MDGVLTDRIYNTPPLALAITPVVLHAICDRGTAPVPHEATNMYMVTHSIYTIFLPPHNAVHMKIFARAPDSLEDA